MSTTKPTTAPKIPRSIWMLGLVSLFVDTSSELVHSLLPIFMVSSLGASMTYVGLVVGIAESTALIVKIFSGTLSDYFQKRKLLTIIGYGLAASTKLLFPLANSMGLVLTARFVDRIGKGIRGAPRDAMVGDIAPAEIRGACFGLRQSLDTVGAFFGPLLAIAGMIIFAGNIRTVLWIAVIPALISMIILIFGVEEPKIHYKIDKKPSLQLKEIYNLSSEYWKLVLIAGIFTLTKFSDAFLILKAQAIGFQVTFVPLIMVIMNIIYAFGAYPAGILSDKVNRKVVLLIGIVLLIIANIILAMADDFFMLVLGIIFWGMHMAFTQGLLATMVTDTTAPEIRGTAYGIFNFVCGIAMLLSSIIAGILWDQLGSSSTFIAGAIGAALACICLLVIYIRQNKRCV